MELSDIDARIAQLKEQIALKEAAQKQVKEAYHNPYSKYHYGYIFDAVAGDRSGLDREAAEEAAYQKLLMEQAQADKEKAQAYYNTAYENELNRQNALKLAEQSRTTSGGADETAKLMREVEYAQAEYEAAKDMVDKSNPQSIANFKKAASKYNYWIKQLPKEFEGYEPYTMEVTEDAPSVKLNKNKKWLDAHKGNEKLTDAEQEEYDRRVLELPEEEQEQYKVTKAKKGSTVETAEKNELKDLIEYEKAGLLSSSQRSRLNALRKKYPGVK